MNDPSRKYGYLAAGANDRRCGLTLIELMVTLVLSVLVLGMVLPLLTSLLKPHPIFATTSSIPPLWQRALQADLQELVSPSKCGVPVFQILAASEAQPYPELILETFCRASGTDLNSLSRGPSEVRYCLEADHNAGPLILVRYAKGWHDPVTSRYVLAEHLTQWSIDFDGATAALPVRDTPVPAGPTADVRPGRLRIQQTTLTSTNEFSLWVSLLQRAPAKSDQASDSGMESNKAGTESPLEMPP